MLVVVLAVLALLSLSVVTFVRYQGLEHAQAVAAVDALRARLLARSGLETAAEELDRIFRTTGGFVLRPGPDGRTVADLETRWRAEGDAPSLAAGTVTVDGAPLAFSGTVGEGTHAPGGDLFVLRIEDESGKINVNDGSAWGPDHLTSRNVARLLDALGSRFDPPAPDLGRRLLAARPPGGYGNVEDLLGALGGDVALWERARRHVTVHGWSDPNVANPVPLSAAMIAEGYYPFPVESYGRPAADNGDGSGRLFRLGHQLNYRRANDGRPLRFYAPGLPDFHNAIYQHDSLNPLWIEVTARSPVNVNTASREVLVALLTDLQGFFSSIERRRDRPRSRPPEQSTPDNYRWFKYQVYTYDPTGARANEDPISAQHPPGPSGGDGDECGFLYTTMKFADTDAPAAGELSARALADHLIACRSRKSFGGVDYAALPFGGPFRSWSQFAAFCDHLAREDVGVIAENRDGWFFDYYRGGTPMPGPSWVQKRLAAQAAADVLKANFNPNLALNELNPDRNLFLHVDKTDLLVHSTEFCFVPVGGRFSVESTGIVLRPAGAADRRIAAARTARAVVELWRAERQTSMAHFYGGAGSVYSPRQGPWSTNNNCSVEVGPEVDNGPIAAPPGASERLDRFGAQNRYAGYVALPTMGGPIDRPEARKPWNAWVATADFRGAEEFPPDWRNPDVSPDPPGHHDGIAREKIHAHFAHDAACHYHSDHAHQSLGAGVGMPAGAWRFFWSDWPAGIAGAPGGSLGRGVDLQNVPDLPEPRDGLGFYEPTSWKPRGGGEARHRLCRAFTGPTVFDPPAYAPSDLRIDGVYSEQNATPGYVITDLEAFEFDSSPTWVGASSWRFREGTTSFWFKPNWFPQSTGKIRTILDMSRYKTHAEALWRGDAESGSYGLSFPGALHDPAAEADTMPDGFHESVAVLPFGLFYFPAHGEASGGPPGVPDDSCDASFDTAGGTGRLRPASFGFGAAFNRHNGDWFGRAARDAGFHAAGDPRALGPGGLARFRSVLHDAVLTPSLNHEGHGPADNHDPLVGEDGRFNLLRGHEWVHVTVSWKLPIGRAPNGCTFQIFLNGRPVPGAAGRPHHYADEPAAAEAFAPDAYPWGFLHEALLTPEDGLTRLAGNTLRLGGGPSEIIAALGREWSFRSFDGSRGLDPFPLRFSSDATYDELYHWDRTGGTGDGPLDTGSATEPRPILEEAGALWARGRYYRPTDASPADFSQTTFVSAPFAPAGEPARRLAPPAEAGPAAPVDEAIRLVGLSWTLVGEETRGGVPVLLDWRDPTAPVPIEPAVAPDANGFVGASLGDLYLLSGARAAGPFRHEAFSPAGMMEAAAGEAVRFRLKFRIDAVEPILLATPVLEDVTLYWRRGRAPRWVSCCWSLP